MNMIKELSIAELDYVSAGGSSEGKSRAAGESVGRKVGQALEDGAEAVANAATAVYNWVASFF